MARTALQEKPWSSAIGEKPWIDTGRLAPVVSGLRREQGQSATETLLVMMFLMLLVFGFIHLSMLATTKYLVNFAAFSEARTVMIGGESQNGAKSALLSLHWAGSTLSADDNTTRTIRGTTRSGVTVQYSVPFGGIFNIEPNITGFAPFTPQPEIQEVGDNAEQ